MLLIVTGAEEWRAVLTREKPVAEDTKADLISDQKMALMSVQTMKQYILHRSNLNRLYLAAEEAQKGWVESARFWLRGWKGSK